MKCELDSVENKNSESQNTKREHFKSSAKSCWLSQTQPSWPLKQIAPQLWRITEHGSCIAH